MRRPILRWVHGWPVAVVLAFVFALPAGTASEPARVPASPSLVGSMPTGPGVVIAPAFVPHGGQQLIGPLPPGAPLSVLVALARSDPDGLARQIELEYTTGSPSFHQFMTAGEIADRFGPSLTTYSAAVAYFRSQGLSVSTSPDRTVLLVQGASSLMARAFGTSFERYSTGIGWFYDHPGPATLPSGLPWAGAIGLGNASPLRPHARPISYVPVGPAPTAAPCQTSSWGVTPCEAHLVYNLTKFIRAGTNGSGYRIGIVDTYDGSEPQPRLKSDLTSFTRLYSIASEPLTFGNVSFVYPVPTSRDLNSSYTIWGVEEALDLEWTRAMAPGASIDMTFAPDASSGLYAAVDWLVAHQAVDVITMSWGEPDVGIFNAFSTPCQSACNATSDGSYTILHPVLQAAAAEGISVFASTGDCGASSGTSGLSTGYPASDPYVTGVGGTALTLNASGGRQSETGWSGNSSGASSPGCFNQGGSTGGWSPFPRPYWQQAPGNLSHQPTLRGSPDISALAASPGAPIVLNGQNGTSGGTSLSSPMWAGIAAVADQRAASALGFLNPSLYAIARNASTRAAFHDIRTGWNGYSAGPGWDEVTGLGTPDGAKLLPLLSRTSAPYSNITVNLTASPRFGAAPLNVTFRSTASGGQRPYAFFDIGFGDGNSTKSTSGVARYTYRVPGVYSARAVAFDNASNSSVSVPVAVVVGGGGPLNVTLNATPQRPAVGGAVTLRVSVSGGVAPYLFDYAFGDGTFLYPSNRTSVSHTYAAVGSFCASVIASDARRPPDGSQAPPVAIAVGGAALPTCAGPSTLRASLTLSASSADLPGDLQFRTNATGGNAPYSAQYSSDDPYVGACQCGVFSQPGNHTVSAVVADSSRLQGSARQNVTIYPTLIGQFAVSRSSGPVPLSVVLSDSGITGGHGSAAAIASATRWSFGDGSNATGAIVPHVYSAPGRYQAVGWTTDGYGGSTSEAFLIDVYPSGPSPLTILSANITPAVGVPAGSLVTLSARVTGTQGPYLVRWDLGENDSAFGPFVTQTYRYSPCRSSGTCPLSIQLGAEDRQGLWTNATVLLAPSVRGNASALRLTEALSARSGATPFALRAVASALGMPMATIHWWFGDGTEALGPSGNHTYLGPGNYTLWVEATDPLGDHLVRTQAIRVVGLPRYPPTVVGGPNVTSGVVPLTVRFAAVASGGGGAPYTFAWSFGDGWTSTLNRTDHRFDLPGHFTVNLTVTDRLGDPATASYAVGVYNITQVGFGFVGWNRSLPAGGQLAVVLAVTPVCRPDSLPGCAASAVPFRAAIFASTAPPPPPSSTAGVLARAGSDGRANITLSAPGVAGGYRLYVWASAAGYVGGNGVSFVVTGGSVVHTHPPIGPIDWVMVSVLLGTVAAGAAIIVGASRWVHRRRRALLQSPERPPPEDRRA